MFLNDLQQRLNGMEKKKITTIKNEGQELILNFSGKEITAGNNQVVLPQEWVHLK